MTAFTQEIVAPAPWRLKGQGYLVVVQLPKKVLDNDGFIDENLRVSRRGRLAYVAFVDYQESDVGRYHELLYIGGSLKFGQKRHYSISKIYVSSQASVDNGRRNWGIPKELADFNVQYGNNAKDVIQLNTPTGETIAKLNFSHYLLPFPVNTKLAPKRLLTIAQQWQGQYFFYRPEADGHLKPALLTDSYFDARYFPDLNQGRVVACFKVTDFNLLFPIAKIQAAIA